MLQSQALHILKTGANVFLTGEPGAGKTYILNQYLDYLSAAGLTVAITASTGIAATHIGGMTIHSWSGIGARDSLSDRDIDFIVQKEKIVKRTQKTHVLVIDEISMLSAEALDGIERVCRTIRGNGEAFGGMQIVVVGDFFQLPPITPFGSEPRLAFQSDAWARAGFIACYLSEQHRQEDEMLSSLLSSIRKGEVEEEHYTLLNDQKEIAFENIEPTRLFTHNKDVDVLNNSRLAELGGRAKRYTMKGNGTKLLVEGLKKNCLSPELLDIREDALVMCTKNNFEAGYVNGTLGRVVGYSAEQFPVVEIATGERVIMKPAQWQVVEDGRIKAEVVQIPLRLAWAITIHKSQGMSLDAAEIDLRNAFTYGQGYVALSRVRTLAGMKILGLNANALMVDPRVIDADVKFHKMSDEADASIGVMSEEELKVASDEFIEKNGGRIPKDGAEISKRTAKKLEPKIDTHALTAGLVKKGLSMGDIIRERKLTATTLWSHIEKLFTEDVISHDAVVRLLPKGVLWEDAYPRIEEAFIEHGTEKLKPIYDHLNEEIPYEVIRIARVYMDKK